jgi:hypothetical protein
LGVSNCQLGRFFEMNYLLLAGILHNEKGIFIPWSCGAGQQYLQQDYSQLVNPSTGALTAEGDKAVGCIRNGAIVAAIAEKHGMSA